MLLDYYSVPVILASVPKKYENDQSSVKREAETD